ncbi:MAG: amidohydrolase family protein [Cyclobacteriaceae bacterium]
MTKKTVLLITLSIACTLRVMSQAVAEDKIALINVTVIDVVNAQQIKNRTIIIEDDLIQSIQHSDSINLSDVGKRIDLTGKYIIPGLIDSHVHLFRPNNRKEILTQFLYSGITTVRDMGGDARVYQSLNDQIKEGSLEGPDIFYSANVFGPAFLKDPRTKFAALGYEPGSAPWMRMITDESNLQTVVKEAKEAGVTGLKVYSNVSPELLLQLSEVAHSHGLKMWSHSSIYPSKPSDAVKANVDVLSHSIGMIFELENNMPLSFNDAIGESVPLLDFKNTDASASAFISLFEQMIEKNIIFEPTLSAWSVKFRPEKPQNNPNPQKSNPTQHLANAANKLDIDAMDNWAQRITKSAYQNGVTIAAGTDLNTNIKWVQDEVILLTECGMSNNDALKAATLNNAKTIGIDNTHGSITVGKKANFVVLSDNPIEDIENIRSVLSVYKNGKEYKQKE